MILRSVEVGSVAENCYVVGDETSKECLIIDPGAEAPRIIEMVESTGCRPVKIINTHGHPDHVGAVTKIQRQYHLQFWMHEADVPVLSALPSFAAYMGEPDAEIPTVDHFLADGDVIPCGVLTLNVLHTPGHTAGGVCFLIASEKTILVGDTLFAGSIGRTDLPGGDHQQLLDSIHRQLLPLGDDLVCYSGHGPKTTIGRERKTNPFLTGGTFHGIQFK